MRPVNPLWDRIVEARKAVGITVVQLYKKAHCSPFAVYAIRDFKSLPRPEVMARIADVVKLPREELLRLAGYPEEIGDPWARQGRRGPAPGWRKARQEQALSPESVEPQVEVPEQRYFPARAFSSVCSPRKLGARASWDWVDWRRLAKIQENSHERG